MAEEDRVRCSYNILVSCEMKFSANLGTAGCVLTKDGLHIKLEKL